MPENLEQPNDLHAITQLLVGWGMWRDTCNWARLRACYTADAHMLTTWFDGPASGFVDASEKMARAGTTALQHFIGTPVIELNGDFALAATRAVVLVRGLLDGVAVDATCYARFHDRLARQDGAWRIQRRVPIYEKDRVEPVEPGVAVTFDQQALQKFPAHYRYLSYMQSRGGAVISMDLPAPLSEAEHRLAEEDRLWLRTSGAAKHISIQPQT